MVSRRLRLALCGCLAFAASALPAAALSSTEPPTPIRLLAPSADTPLVGGDEAEIAWEPLDEFAALGKVEEWEAFLSLDGGATYPFRLTPHLDQDLRRFRWRVPAVPSGDARLLFRFGDERSEVAVVLPQRFGIEPPAVGAPFDDETFTIGRRSSRLAGESALPGQRGVVAWVEGSRRGTGVRQVLGFGLAMLGPAQMVPESPFATDIEVSRQTPRDAIAEPEASAEEPRIDHSADAPALAPPRPCADLLLLGQRRNE